MTSFEQNDNMIISLIIFIILIHNHITVFFSLLINIINTANVWNGLSLIINKRLLSLLNSCLLVLGLYICFRNAFNYD